MIARQVKAGDRLSENTIWTHGAHLRETDMSAVFFVLSVINPMQRLSSCGRMQKA